jgi:hypothetical protein
LSQIDRKKYGHPEYSDGEVEGLMQYFRFETYLELLHFLKNTKLISSRALGERKEEKIETV